MPQTVVHWVPLSMEFSTQKYQIVYYFCVCPGDLPNLRIKLESPALQVDSLPSEPPGKPRRWFQSSLNNQNIQIKAMFTYIYSITKRNLIYVQFLPEPNINHQYEFLKIIQINKMGKCQISIFRRAQQPTPVCLPGKSPWTEEPGGLQAMGPQRVGHD